MIYSFPAVRFVMSTLLSRMDHSTIFGRSETCNSTHHRRYVFPSMRSAASLSISSLSLSSYLCLATFSLSLSLCPCLRVMLCVMLCCVVCVSLWSWCVCVRCGGGGVGGRRGGGGRRGETHRTIWLLVPYEVSLRITDT